ncbi:MAG: NAD-dependent succinate-semialdehyde dehydrogenase, partial [Arthrobacter sp.]|nr:NAD-dependent succinate-semialdehyde dehydrogenase [Arthrobacter sp.]
MVEIPSTTKLTADHGTFSIPTGLFLNGEWRPAQDEAHIPVVNPATGEEFAAVSDASLKDAAEALDAASAAQEAWGLTKPRVRAELLRKAFDAVIARTEDFAWTMATEMGKPLAEARGEVAYAAEFLRWFSEQVPSQTGNYGPAPDGDYRIITTYQPVGPSLLITPWNFPLAMGTRKVGAALAAGCTVIIKPASQTPLTMHLFVEVLRSVGIPDGVVNLVTTSKSGAQSAALMSDRRLRKVSFTGSTGVG